MKQYQDIYKRLDQLIPGGIEAFLNGNQDYLKLKSSGYMDLHIDKLGSNKIALAHNGKQNGDNMADPDMEIQINLEHKFAIALTYQNDYAGVYQCVCPEPGIIDQKLKKQLNSFLLQWLKNLKQQGHK